MLARVDDALVQRRGYPALRRSGTQRHVNEDDEAEPVPFGHQNFAHRRGDQSVDHDDGTVRDAPDHLSQASPRSRIRPGPRTGRLQFVHGPAGIGETPAHPPVVDVSAARPGRVVDAGWDDHVDGGHRVQPSARPRNAASCRRSDDVVTKPRMPFRYQRGRPCCGCGSDSTGR